MDWNMCIGKRCGIVLESQDEKLMSFMVGDLTLLADGSIFIVSGRNREFLNIPKELVKDGDVFFAENGVAKSIGIEDVFDLCDMVIVITITIHELEEE